MDSAGGRGRGVTALEISSKEKVLDPLLFFTARQRSCGEVMFLQLSVSHFVHRGMYTP